MGNNELIGRFALSEVGHDKGALYVITACDNGDVLEDEAKLQSDNRTQKGYVYLCDGKYHTLDKPKKKSLKHIALQQEGLAADLRNRFINEGILFDHEIKYAIKQQQERKEEGYVKE